MRSALLLSLCFSTLSGCLASTDVESMVRPDWEPKPFDRIVVYYGSSDLEDRRQVEDRFAAKDSAFVPAYELFFAGETNWTKERVREVMAENEVDAALVLNPKGAGSTSTLIPGQTTTTCTGNTCTSQGGPIVASFPDADFGAVLLDWETEQTVWTASAESGGNAFAGQRHLRESFVDEVVQRLREDGFLDSAGRDRR